jgi:hypothetical protein
MHDSTENSHILSLRRSRNFIYGLLLTVVPTALILPCMQLLNYTPTTWVGAVSFAFSVLCAVSELSGIRLLLHCIVRNEGTYGMKLCATLASVVGLFTLALYLWSMLPKL